MDDPPQGRFTAMPILGSMPDASTPCGNHRNVPPDPESTPNTPLTPFECSGADWLQRAPRWGRDVKTYLSYTVPGKDQDTRSRGEVKRQNKERISELQVQIDKPKTLLQDKRQELQRKLAVLEVWILRTEVKNQKLERQRTAPAAFSTHGHSPPRMSPHLFRSSPQTPPHPSTQH
ncbi:uncharacterized protein LOC116067762 isoform X2 [Sander lucioperca]|uniref:uncharacterized protein LOC116067762 isoform X2 n=1 Tax=Sander lucioperca TaxID=283035 RepID=UPI00125CDC46|nr:uncharacterized protein LOC116067762 isoform X2 [Sander lucioperca]